MTVNLNADASVPITSPFSAIDPTSYNHTTSVTVFDALGSEHTLSLYFTKNTPAAGSVDWNVNAFMDGTASALSGTLTYSLASGQLTAGAAQVAAGTYPSGTVAGEPFSIALNMAGSTMFSGKFGVNTLTQDGYGKGDLAGLAVTKDGIIQAQYTNGQALTVGQLSLTSFNNPNGLLSVGDNHWISTPDAGTANTQQPNSGILGLIQSGAVEESNVDLTAELVNLIVAQRMYQANAQTIRAQDQILQTLVNLR
jgi:flagellar hook protein FlgE